MISPSVLSGLHAKSSRRKFEGFWDTPSHDQTYHTLAHLFLSRYTSARDHLLSYVRPFISLSLYFRASSLLSYVRPFISFSLYFHASPCPSSCHLYPFPFPIDEAQLESLALDAPRSSWVRPVVSCFLGSFSRVGVVPFSLSPLVAGKPLGSVFVDEVAVYSPSSISAASGFRPDPSRNPACSRHLPTQRAGCLLV